MISPDLATTLYRFEAFLLGEMPRRISQRISRDMGTTDIGISETIITQASHDTVKEVFEKFMSMLPSPVQNIDRNYTSEVGSTAVASAHENCTSSSPSHFLTTSSHPAPQSISPWVYDNTYTYDGPLTQPLHIPCQGGDGFPDPVMLSTSESYVPDAYHNDNCWRSICQAGHQWPGPR